MFVWYEHFATEHVRGHHPRLGTREDPATARFGETFREFFWRTVPAQFKSAWHLEKVRLGDANMSWYDPRMLRHRVLQGVIAADRDRRRLSVFFGWIAGVFFLMQARMAVMLLEAVNYIEHWGMTRAGKTVTAIDSWDTDNWFTLLHAGRAVAARRSPRAGLAPVSTAAPLRGQPRRCRPATTARSCSRCSATRRYRTLATAELERRKLGPFRGGDAELDAETLSIPGPASSAVA